MNELMEMLRDLRERGAAWVINTGRSLYQTLEGLTLHGIRQIPDFIIAREGELYHRSQYNRWIDVGEWNAQRARDHKKLYKSKEKFFRELQNWLRERTAAKWISEPQEPAGIVSSTEAEMEGICEWLDAQLPEHRELSYQRNSIYLRFTHEAYSKGTALAELSAILQIMPEHMFVAGDNHNDLSMLTTDVAHHLACPVNAIPLVQAAVAQHDGFISEHPSTLGCVESLDYYFYS